MPRKIAVDFSYDDMENEVLYTRGALAADPDAADLLPVTDGWLGLVEAGRSKDRAGRTATIEASALRAVANRRLDAACRDFGRELSADLKNDRTSARWSRFFRTSVDAFIAQPLKDQAASCLAWLASDDAVLVRHAEVLRRWATAAESALSVTSTSVQARGAAAVAREATAEDLTKARDGLEAALIQRGLERGLGRDFASGFFVQERRGKGKKVTEPVPA